LVVTDADVIYHPPYTYIEKCGLPSWVKKKYDQRKVKKVGKNVEIICSN